MARLDAELVARGIARSRERAKEMISGGAVTVNGRIIKKPSCDVTDADEIVSSEEEIYVGRGALKLHRCRVYRYRSLDRRLHGVYAHARCLKGLCSRCGTRTAC